MKKIRLTCSWCDDKTLYERFTRVYLSKYNYNKSFQFTIENNFDYLVIINGPTYNINFPKEKTLGIIMEPYNSPTVKLYKPYLEQLCKHILWHYEVDQPQYIFYPGLLPYHMDYNEGKPLDYYIDSAFKKTKLCSFIVSYNENNSFPNSIYKQRVNFAKQILNTNLDIDIYGNNWEQANIKDSRIKGTLKNKKDGLIDYKFSIAIENCIEEGYFTEKITDCILTNTFPIYYGCPGIEKYFNNVYKLPNLDDIISLQEILALNNNYISNKKIMSEKYNLFTAITKYFTKIK